MVKNVPLCEVCQREPATVIVGFRKFGSPTVERWQFTCAKETDPEETESFSIAEFFHSPQAMVDRLADMHESGRIDWAPFMDMLVRLRAAQI